MNALSTIFGGEKMFRHLDRLAAWQAGKLPPPVTVELDLTNACNHACPGCTFNYLVNIDKSSIPFDLARLIVRQLGDFGVKALTFSGGGEPLVYGEALVLELMAEARAAGMDTALITNGSLLRSEVFLELCEWVRVSLDAYDAATFERFHGRGPKEFAKVVENCRAFGAAAIRRKAAGQKCATFGVGFLTNRDSVRSLDFAAMAEFCAGIEGLDYLQFRPLVSNMVADPSLTGGYAGFTQDHLAELLDAYGKAARAFGRPDFAILLSEGKYRALAQAGYGRTYSRCHAHFLEATIGADCRVYICCHGQGQDGYCLGDLRENTFAEIWHGEQARQVYESIRPSERCPPACRLHQQNAALEQIAGPAEHANFI